VYAGVDPVYEPIPIRPVVHYMMGGIDTDIDGATTLPGLYAAGETACVSLNGRQPASAPNSLTECLVFGARAGSVAVQYAAGHRREQRCDGPAPSRTRESGRLAAARESAGRGSERLAQLRRELNQTMGGRLRRVPRAGVDGRDGAHGRPAQAAHERRAGSKTRARCSTPSSSRRSSSTTCSRCESLTCRRRTGASRAARTRAATSRARRPELPLPHALLLRPRRVARLGKKPVTLGKWVPGGEEVLIMSDSATREAARAASFRSEPKASEGHKSGPSEVKDVRSFIQRFDPDKDEAPRQQSYGGAGPAPNWKVLDALNYIKDELDGTALATAGSCRMAVCRQLRNDGERQALAHLQGRARELRRPGGG